MALASSASASRCDNKASCEYRSVRRSRVSSSSAASFEGDQEATAAGPRITSGTFWPSATPVSVCCAAAGRRQSRERAIQPACLHGVRPCVSILQHILSVEVRPLAIRAGDGMKDDELARCEAVVQECQARMQAEKVVEPAHPVGGPWCGKGELAAQTRVVRIAIRRHYGQPIERASQDDQIET